MKRLVILLVIVMSLFGRPMFAPDGIREAEKTPEQKALTERAKRLEAERKREEAEKKAREEQEARKQQELQKKLDELKIQEEKAQQEKEAARKKAQAEAEISPATKNQLDSLAEDLKKRMQFDIKIDPIIDKPYLVSYEIVNPGITGKDLEKYLKQLNMLPEMERAKAFEQWFFIFDKLGKFDQFKHDYVEALKKTTNKDDLLRGILLLDSDLRLEKTALKNPLELLEVVSSVAWNYREHNEKKEYKDIYTALIASILNSLTFDPRFDELFVDPEQADRLVHVLVLNEDLMMPIEGGKSFDAYTPSERLFFAIITFGQHLVDRLSTTPKNNQAPMAEAVVKMLLSFPIQKYSDKAREWLKSVVLNVDFSTIPGKIFTRDLLFFFKAINDPKKMDQAIQKYVESVGELNSLEALRQAKDFLTKYFSKEFSKNTLAKNSFLKKYIELVKTSDSLSDYRFVIESFKDFMLPTTLIELQFGLLNRLEEHPDLLKEISGSTDRFNLTGDQKFLADMMRDMTDKQLPKSATALFNLIKTVKSVIDDPMLSKDQKERLTILSNALADDIVPTLDWTQRWSGKISSFLDTYLPWWGKNMTYKPHWRDWSQEKRLRILYGISNYDIQHEINYGWRSVKAFSDPLITGKDALENIVKIQALYGTNDLLFKAVNETLLDDAREIFERIFDPNKVRNIIEGNLEIEELYLLVIEKLNPALRLHKVAPVQA